VRQDDHLVKEQHMQGFRTSRLGRLSLGLAAAALGAMALASGASARPFSTSGLFVIGDQSADQSLLAGDTITFWGAQWWKDNSLGGGLAPASFKGFADTLTGNAWCGDNWTTRPGNSSFPPATVGPVQRDGTVEMIVSTHVSKDGPVISGDIAKVVTVRVNPGYGPNPGHPGTGVVVGVLCDGSVVPT
jgi:hypothetical protein